MTEIDRQIASDIVQIGLGLVAISVIALAFAWRKFLVDLTERIKPILVEFKSALRYSIVINALFQVVNALTAVTGTYSPENVQWVVLTVMILSVVVLWIWIIFDYIRGLVRKAKGVYVERIRIKPDSLTFLHVTAIFMLSGAIFWSGFALVSGINSAVGIELGEASEVNRDTARWVIPNAVYQLFFGLLALGASTVSEAWNRYGSLVSTHETEGDKPTEL